jgi:Protein of unknown function (DUF3833)
VIRQRAYPVDLMNGALTCAEPVHTAHVKGTHMPAFSNLDRTRVTETNKTNGGQETRMTEMRPDLRLVGNSPGAAPAIAASVQSVPGVTFDLTRFFDGRTRAHGIFEDRFGQVRRRFDGEFNGRWSGDVFLLDETFTFDDGEVENRVWRLTRAINGSFTATTPDCVGMAVCEAFPGFTRMRYGFNLKMKRRVLPVFLDDRMIRLDETRVINRSSISKWGILLGELTIVLERV